MSLQPLSFPLPGHLSEKALAKLSLRLDKDSLPTSELVAIARVLLEDRHHLERLAQRQQYLDLQEQKRADAKERGDNLAEHRKKKHHLSVRRLELGRARFRHSKKQSKKREEERAAKAKAIQEKSKEKAQAAQTQQAEQSPRTLPRLILTPVSPGPDIEALRIAAGIPKGGVPTTGAAAWYYDDKPELKAERETEAAEMAEIRAESDAVYEARQKGDEPALAAAQTRHAILVEKATQRQERLKAKKLKEDLRILDEKRKAYDRDHPREMRPVLDEQAYNQKVYEEQQAAYEEIDEDTIEGPPLNTAWMQDENWQPPQPDTAAQTESPPQPPCALSQPTALGAVGPTHDDTVPQPPPDPDPDDPPTRLELYQQEQRERKQARNKLLTEMNRKAAYEHRQQNKWW